MPDRIAGVLGALTDRQRECIVRVKKGLSSKEIARELGISPKTVEMHISTAMHRLGVSSRLAIISLLYDEDLQVRDEFVVASPDRNSVGDYVMTGAIRRVSRDASEERATQFLPPFGGSLNTAPRAQRLRWIVLVALLCVMAACAFILSIVGVVAVADRLAS